MTQDFKKLAAGDADLTETNTKYCFRCGQQQEFLKDCKGCLALDKKICKCTHPLGNHVFDYGSYTNKRAWLCRICLANGTGTIICKDLPNDPIKQEAYFDAEYVYCGMKGITRYRDLEQPNKEGEK